MISIDNTVFRKPDNIMEHLISGVIDVTHNGGLYDSIFINGSSAQPSQAFGENT